MKLTLTDSVISELHPRLNETRNETKIFAFGAKLERFHLQIQVYNGP